jgi:hypothetical protein
MADGHFGGLPPACMSEGQKVIEYFLEACLIIKSEVMMGIISKWTGWGEERLSRSPVSSVVNAPKNE